MGSRRAWSGRPAPLARRPGRAAARLLAGPSRAARAPGCSPGPPGSRRPGGWVGGWIAVAQRRRTIFGLWRGPSNLLRAAGGRRRRSRASVVDWGRWVTPIQHGRWIRRGGGRTIFGTPGARATAFPLGRDARRVGPPWLRPPRARGTPTLTQPKPDRRCHRSFKPNAMRERGGFGPAASSRPLSLGRPLSLRAWTRAPSRAGRAPCRPSPRPRPARSPPRGSCARWPPPP
jgi:hypothetical protein